VRRRNDRHVTRRRHPTSQEPVWLRLHQLRAHGVPAYAAEQKDALPALQDRQAGEEVTEAG